MPVLVLCLACLGFGAFAQAASALNTTTTSVQCTPNPVVAGSNTTCTATVTDLGATPSAPEENVRFTTNNPGRFLPGSTCKLVPNVSLPGNATSCAVTYSPDAVGTGHHRITASYEGESSHAASEASVRVDVLAKRIRFAAPGGHANGTTEPCERASPCSIFAAADQSGGAQVGDEVVLEPGEYSDAAGDLGPANAIFNLKSNISLHGEAGQARPVIRLTSQHSFGAFLVVGGDNVSHIEIDSSGSLVNFFLQEGTIEDIVARSSKNNSSGLTPVACFLPGQTGTIRDSACIASGSGAVALGNASGGLVVGNSGIKVRNVTAIASGSGSVALLMRLTGSRPGENFKLDGVGVIARGTNDDVVAEGLSSVPHTPGTGANVEIQLEDSDYDTTATATDAGGGTATISPSGPGTTNIKAPPLLSHDGYHALSGSPTIDAGAIDAESGEFDIDGEPRSRGAAADIGADEAIGAPSTTAVVCAPSTLVVATASTCTASLSGGGAAPSGSVEFLSDGQGSFSAASCPLVTAAGVTSCQVEYTPQREGSQEITAVYAGDGAHDPSEAKTTLTVTPNPRLTGTTLVCSPAVLLPGEIATCTATVSGSPANPSPPSGTVEFKSSATGTFTGAPCTLTTTKGITSCHVTYKPETGGIHEITATYGGDTSHDTSPGKAQLNASPHPTSTTVVCSPSSMIVGTNSTCTATVADNPSDPDLPTGTVEFKSDVQGTISSCQLPIVPGTRSCQVAYKPVTEGVHTITATYTGDSSHTGSQETAQVTASRRSTTTTLRCAPGTLTLGAGSSTCTATVATLGGAPTGTVGFKSGGNGTFSAPSCKLETEAGLQLCHVTYTPSAAGTHTVTATYSGDLNHTGSQGQAQVAVPVPPVVTTPPPPAPNTTLLKKPAKKTAGRLAKFSFGSDQQGAGFQCKLDKGPFKACRSPFKKTVAPGPHSFQVRAVNPQGLADPTPAVAHWLVLRG